MQRNPPTLILSVVNVAFSLSYTVSHQLDSRKRRKIEHSEELVRQLLVLQVVLNLLRIKGLDVASNIRIQMNKALLHKVLVVLTVSASIGGVPVEGIDGSSRALSVWNFLVSIAAPWDLLWILRDRQL